MLIGQPQLDAAEKFEGEPSPDGRQTVLYAPTWEASQPSVSYGSLETHGEKIMQSLLGHYRVIYRPHPLNGVIRPSYAEADKAVRLLAERIDTDVPLEKSFADADLLITDVGLPGGMNGRQVADAARRLRPDLKVLFITGYAENAVIGNGHLERGMEILTKPFEIAGFGQKVRDMIERG